MRNIQNHFQRTIGENDISGEPKLMGVLVVFVFGVIFATLIELVAGWLLYTLFHARWWDYSDMPLNIQGRICVPVSICFGLAGVLIVRFLIPFISGMHAMIHPVVYEILALILAAAFGADFALTEASLSALLKNVEKMHTEFVERAQAGYEKVSGEVSSIGLAVNKEKLAVEERVNAAKEGLSKLYAGRLSFNQRRILVSIERFMPDKKKTSDQNKVRLMLTGELKNIARIVMKKQG